MVKWVGVKGRKGSWGCLRTWCWGKYLDWGGTRKGGELRRLHNEELNDLYCTPHQILCGLYNREEWDCLLMWRVWVRRGGCIGSWWGNRREGDNWWDLGVDGWIILGRISRRWDVGLWTGLGWPRIERGVGRLWVWKWTFGFREKRRISWLAANQVASQGLCPMEGVSK